MKKTQDELEKKIAKLQTPLYRLARAVTTSDWLTQLDVISRDADQIVFDVTAAFATASLISKTTGAVSDNTVATSANTAAIAKNTAAVEKWADVVTTTGNESPKEIDSFRPSFDVPNNPSHVVLSFQSASEVEENTSPLRTIEAKLKWAVLRSDAQSIGAVGSRLTHGVGLEGMSGVGKSCALGGLAKDPDVVKRFRDGVYYINLGKDATEGDVVLQIAKIIRASGGLVLSREVMKEKDIGSAVSKAREWFAERCCLLLIDDVWEGSEAGRDVIARLSCSVDVSSGSRVVFTTRDVRVAMRSEAIHFSARDADVSLHILLASADLREVDIDGLRGIVEQVLMVCNGLPMALAVAGSTIKGKLFCTSGTTMQEVWEEYLCELQNHRDYLLQLTVDNDAYGSVASAFMASLSTLDSSKARKLPLKCRMLFCEMYRALFVLRRQGWVPVSVLRVLWETEDEHEAIHILQRFVEANLAQRENRVLNGRKMAGITLHDLHLDFVQTECKRRRELEHWHRKLLDGYLPEEKSDTMPDGIAGCTANRSWRVEDVFTDEYIRNNASRHFLGAGLVAELFSLLKNPRWVAKRLCMHEILSLEEDFALMVELLLEGEDGMEHQYGSEAWAITMISGAARLSSSYVSRNPGEVWFQMYARLLLPSKVSGVIKTYTSDIEAVAERPWVKALSPCLPGPGGALQSTVLCPGPVMGISQELYGRKLVICGRGDDDETAFVSTVVDGQNENTVWLTGRVQAAASSMHDESGSGNSGRESAGVAGVMAVCCTKYGTRMVIGYRDGTIRLWNAQTGEGIGCALRMDMVPLEVAWAAVAFGRSPSLSLSSTSSTSGNETEGSVVDHRQRDGVSLVSSVASSDEAESSSSRITEEDFTGSPGEGLRPMSWYSSEPVSYVAFPQTESTWPLRHGVVPTRFGFGTLNQLKLGGMRRFGGFACMTWSADNTRFACGSADLSGAEICTLQVWNAETWEAACAAMEEQVGLITCVALSTDGKRLASGSDHGIVQFWNAETGECISDNALHWDGGDSRVQCIAWSADGKQVASAGEDKLIRVWNAETGESVGDVLRGHREGIQSIAWSADGKGLVTGSRDGTVRIWKVAVTGSPDDTQREVKDKVKCFAWSMDGKRLACGSQDGNVQIWDVETGKEVVDALPGHTGAVRSVAWSANGRRVASGSNDGTARIWDGKTGRSAEGDIRGHSGAIYCVACQKMEGNWQQDHGMRQCGCEIRQPGKYFAIFFVVPKSFLLL